jgi:hypothetical protein
MKEVIVLSFLCLCEFIVSSETGSIRRRVGGSHFQIADWCWWPAEGSSCCSGPGRQKCSSSGGVELRSG